MARTRRPAMVLGSLALSALLFAGCKGNGGGWIDSTQGAKKATFGFTFQTEGSSPGDLKFVGSGTWNDGPVKIRMNGGSVEDDSGNCVEAEANYTSTNKTQPGSGTADLQICDNGEPGSSSGDTISITLSGGPFDGYSNSGTIRGGNLTVKD